MVTHDIIMFCLEKMFDINLLFCIYKQVRLTVFFKATRFFTKQDILYRLTIILMCILYS